MPALLEAAPGWDSNRAHGGAANDALDPERIGGLAWTQRTQGALSSAERRRLLGEIVRGQAGYIAGRIRLAPGRTPEAAAQSASPTSALPTARWPGPRKRPAASRPPV